MMEQAATVNDFVAETKGHCFLCSNKASCQSSLSSSNGGGSKLNRSSMPVPMKSSTHTLYGLSRFLGMDMKKAFTGDGPIPPDLVVRLERSKLRAGLCEGCASLTKTFSGLLRRLEKAEMEVASCLNLIHGKLKMAEDSDKTYGSNSTANSLEDELIAKLEITEALRKDAVQKCCHKLSASRHPSVKLKRLTGKQVDTEKLKVKLNSKSAIRNQQESNQDSESNYEPGAIGSLSSVPLFDDDPDESNDSIVGSPAFNQELIGRRPDPNVEPPRQHSSKVNPLSQTIPPPKQVAGGAGIVEQRIELNLNKGKYKCPNCSREFGSKPGCQLHYESVHLKMRHKCGLCGKQFPQKNNYEIHYLNLHMGVKFKCGECDKTFATKNYLTQHQNAHLGRQFKCEYCDEKFSLPQSRYAHMKNKCSRK